ncbi:uncharacterized protein LOC125211378 isoform X2 [Salvia hispanica]|uniref:uncharacterized protein LOC125211378 isoform X2 n=1 Tax=Salvia hispanica TaxID=49212 RepID=UPI002009647F|nr:uncharacterized protein LOC125211378 isoform X2 [Salvia hispanica]
MRGVFVINFLIEKKNNCLFIVTKIKKMRISELTEDRSEPDVMPEKSGGSAKIDHTVSTMPAEEVNVKNGRTAAAFAKIGKAVATPLKSSCSYGFVTLAKIGYVVRVRVVYRIVPSMSDDVETLISVYPANFPLNSALRQSDDAQKFISGQDAGTPLKNQCGDSDTYKFRFLTFARMGYTATVEVFDRIGHWMASPEAKSTMIMYITILAKNARYYALQHDYKFADGKAAFLIVLSNTLIEILNEHITRAKEKAGAQEEYVSGSQELMKSASVDGHDWFSAAYKILKDILGVIPLNEILVFMVKEFRAFLRKAPSIFSKGFLTMESLGFMMREFFVFMMKQFFGAQFISHIDELVVLVLRELFGIDLVNESGFSGSATKGRKKKKQMNKY